MFAAWVSLNFDLIFVNTLDFACFVIYETSSIEQTNDIINKHKVERKLGVVNKVPECLQTPLRF